MKKRIFSLLVAMVLALGLLPMAALAEEEVAEAADEELTENAEIEATAEPTVEPTVEPTGEPTVEPTATPAPTPEESAPPLEAAEQTDEAVAAVQALIDALPEAQSITTEDYDAVAAQLDAIDGAKLALTDEQRGALDFARYQAAIAALEAIDGMAGAGEPETLANELKGNQNSQTWSGGEYKLKGDTTLKKGCTITVTGNVTLDLNGKTLKNDFKITPDNPIASMIVVQSGATLTIKDSSSGQSGKIVAAMQQFSEDKACIRVEQGGKLVLQSGTVSGQSYDGWARTAGGVYVAGTFNMTGGKITDCSVAGSGKQNTALGVYVASGGEFKLSGGSISGGSTSAYSTNFNSKSAGGVCVDGGTFTMSGGSISGFSTAQTPSAGGVYVASGTFTMSGGSITNCNASADGSAGGVYVAGGTFTMSGGSITQCYHNIPSRNAYGSYDGVYTGAGGVYVASGGAFAMSGSAWINSCYAVNRDTTYALVRNGRVVGGVYNAGIFTMTGGTCSFCYFYPNVYNKDDTSQVCEIAVSNAGTMNANGGTVWGLYNKSSGTVQSTATNPTSFDCYATNATHENFGTITGGSFSGTLNSHGEIRGGKFSGTVNVLVNMNDRCICVPPIVTGGTFNAEVKNVNGHIKGGTFENKVTNYGVIYGGVFKAEVYSGKQAAVCGGDFSQAGTLTNIYKITFDLNGGTLTDGTAATQWRHYCAADEPNEPTKEGAYFMGWELDDTLYTFPRLQVNQDVTNATIALKAEWGNVEPIAITASPTAKTGLAYDGTAKELITPGTAGDGGTMKYRIGSGEWSTSIPKATEAGQYVVSYYAAKAENDNQHVGSAVHYITVTIAPCTLTETSVSVGALTYTGSEQEATVTVTGVKSVGLQADTDYTLSGDTKGTDADAYRLVVTGTGNYDGTVVKTWSIGKKSVSPSLSLSQTSYSYSGEENRPTVTVKEGTVALPEAAYTVSYADNLHAGTATVTVKATNNYSFAELSETFTIAPRAITLASGSQTREYNGETLTDSTVTVTAGSMVEGESLAYSFTGGQTAVGSSQNRFTATDSTTTKAADYTIDYQYGLLTVTVPAALGEDVKNLTASTVTSENRESIEQTLGQVKDYLKMEPDKDESVRLRALEEQLQELIDRLDETQKALDDKTIAKTDSIDETNAKPKNQSKLEAAQKAIEQLLEQYGNNLTAAEKQQLSAKLERIEKALAAIGRQTEKRADEPKAPRTGDAAQPLLYLALALGAAAAAAVVIVVAKRKRK